MQLFFHLGFRRFPAPLCDDIVFPSPKCFLEIMWHRLLMVCVLPHVGKAREDFSKDEAVSLAGPSVASQSPFH